VTSPYGTESAAAPAVPDGAPWRRLDRRMLAIRPLQALFRAAVPLAVLLLVQRDGAIQQVVGLVAALLVVLAGMAHWFTTRYRIGATQVELVTGLLRRRRLAVPLDRVRSVDVTASPLHRLLGVAVVKVGTGSQAAGEHDELTLDAVSAAEATQLRGELLHRGARAEPATDAPRDLAPTPAETPIARLDLRWLRFAPFTLSGLVTAGAIVGFVANFANEVRPDLGGLGAVRGAADQVAGLPLAGVAVVVAVGLVVVVSLLSVGGYLVGFWNFSLTRHAGGTLHVQRGLLTTRAVSLEERRLRGVEVSEPLLVRAVHGARTVAIATGLSGGAGGALLLPPAPLAEARRVAAAVLRDPEPLATPLHRHGPAARRRRYTRALGVVTVGVAALYGAHRWAGLPRWPWIVALLLLPVAALLAADRYRNLGHALTGGYLVGRSGSVTRDTFALRRDGIIGWRFDQSLFQRRAGLTTVTATTAGGSSAYTVPDLAEAAAIRLADEAVPGLLIPFLQR
jgi:putative membrane protein